MAPALLPSPPYPKPPPRHPSSGPATRPLCRCGASRRDLSIQTAVAVASAAAAALRPAAAAEEAPPSAPPPPNPLPRKGAPLLGGIANTKSWPQYYGSGFSIRVPPPFEDILEPEDFNAAMTYYGDKAKIRAYAARFASPDRSEIVSVVIKPSNQLKITFLEAKDITDLGTLKEASKLFVPGAAKLYSARTIKVKDEEDIRTYYFYEFGFDRQHVALMTTVDSGKTYIAAATAPETKWDTDGVKLRSAAVSMSLS